jgi:predicted transglutaminase-like cysteine proteinase
MASRIIHLSALIYLGLISGAFAQRDMSVGAIPSMALPTTISMVAPQMAPQVTTIPSGAPNADVPPGYVGFCIRMPEQCQIPIDAPQFMSATPAMFDALQTVNAQVNAAIWPEDDMRHYGRAEYWTIPTDGFGDCEDYALAKRKALVDAGFSPAALRVAIVVTPDESRHAVLTVVTDKGDYVLDNMRAEIVPWNRTDYAWVERQDPHTADAWDVLDTTAMARVASAGAVITGSAK